jgi:hypothetical protein
MRRRTGILLVALFAAALVVAAYFIRRDKQVVVVDPWVAVPSDAFMVLETPDFPELLTRITDPAGMMTRLSGLSWAASLLESAAAVDSVTGGREVREMLSNKRVVISLHAGKRGSITPLAVAGTGTSVTPRRLSSLLSASGASVADARDLGGTRRYSVTYGRGSRVQEMYFALTSGIIIATPSEALLSAALDNKSTGTDIRQQQGVSPVANASGKDADNIFILFRNLPAFLRPFIPPDNITRVTTAAIAAGGDIAATEEGLFISGFLTTSATGNGADMVREVTPAGSGVHELLPEGTSSYTTVMRRASLKGETASDAASVTASDLALMLSPFTGSEVTTAMVPAGRGSERVRIFRMTDRQSAEQVLRKRLTEKYRAMGLSERYFVASAGDADGEERVLYKMPFPGVASILSGETGRGGDDIWATFERSYMLFSASPDALANLIRESGRENTLINDPEFRQMERTMPSKSSWIFYSSGAELREIISSYLTQEAAAEIGENSLAGIAGVGLSLTPSNGMIYAALSVRYRDSREQRGQSASGRAETVATGADGEAASGLKLLWRAKLEAAAAVRPFLFTNHNTGATEIFIQDEKNNIYLISASGKILWKAPVRERIRGDIFMIDYYRNGKNQLLFSGKDYLHLIDRNGNYVDKYPVKMRSPASNFLAVFDYENNRDYRLCIAGEDRKIYIYDRAGSPVRGWNMFTTRGRVTDPVRFFRVRGKDYLIAADDQDVYVLDRTGNIRVAHQEPLRKAGGSAISLAGGDDNALIFTATNGTVIRLLFDGTVSRQSTGTLSEKHSADFTDLNGDGTADIIIIDGSSLRIFGSDGIEISTNDLGSGSLRGPALFTTGSSDRRIGVYDAEGEMLYLFGKNGSIVSGFPLKSGEHYNIGRVVNKSTWSLLITDSDSYIYNYELGAGPG